MEVVKTSKSSFFPDAWSPERLRLEHDLSGRFFPLHFYATEEEVLPDYDYADLFQAAL